MIVGDELGIGHDPGQHAAYVGSWIKALQDEPLEVFRAAADAEKIHDYVLAFEQKQVQEQDQQQSQAQDEAVAQALAVDIAEVLDNPDVSFSHYQAFQGDTLEDALRSRGLETVGSITGTDPELAGRDRRQRAPRLVVHEPGSQGEDELLAAVHPTAHYITLCRVDAGVAIDVVGVGSTPLAHKVVVAVKGRPARVAMEHGP